MEGIRMVRSLAGNEVRGQPLASSNLVPSALDKHNWSVHSPCKREILGSSPRFSSHLWRNWISATGF